jgi:hypothetical protein
MKLVNDPKWIRRKLREGIRKRENPNEPVKNLRVEVVRMPTIRKK